MSVLPNRLEILDSEQRVIFLYGRRLNKTLGEEFTIFNALVSAYNAAGERKRIEIAQTTVSSGRVWSVAGELIHGPSRREALASYVERHASDLGLEIVES